ncbi:MAG: hypothetical protein ACOVMM_05735 [Chitinophagaceae bacterium]
MKSQFYYTLKRYRIILFNWEYWSFNVVYFPIYFYWIWLSIKAKSFFFFSTSNPTIENGGFMMECKNDIYDILPQQFYPKTILIKRDFSFATIEALLLQHQLQFPLVAKPNIGERGNDVKKLLSKQEIINYHSTSKVDFLIQEWCNYNNEIGLFYCKYPHQSKGIITGIVQKEFLTITGDGVNTIEALMQQNDRYFLQINALKKINPNQLNHVLQKDEKQVLVPYGNHCRGSKFVDYGFKIDAQLTHVFNVICNQIPGFYFGRMDIRFENWELLKEGKNFSIIELNGAGSEPTHIYDPKHSIFFAWKEIIKHLNILYEISVQNKKKYNLNFMSFKEGMQLLRTKKEYDILANTKN